MDSTDGRVFEDFVPPHTMVREPATHTLTVDLSAAGKHTPRMELDLAINLAR